MVITLMALCVACITTSLVVHGFETLTDANFKRAAVLWCNNNPKALTMYGNITGWNTSQVTDMTDAFYEQRTFNGDISKWDVSNVLTLQNTFYSANFFNADISKWQVQSVVSLKQTFFFASAFNADLSRWDVSQVTDMEATFQSAILFNASLAGWQVSKVVTLQWSFNNARQFTSDLSTWNVSKVTSFSSTFKNARVFNSDLSNWDIVSATTLKQTFRNAYLFNSDLSKWKVAKVKSVTQIFYAASKFKGKHLYCGGNEWEYTTLLANDFKYTAESTDTDFWCGRPDLLRSVNIKSAVDDWIFGGDRKRELLENLPNIEDWDTSNVTNMERLFFSKTSFSSDLSKWNTKNVVSMEYTFQYARAFNSDLSKWKTSKVQNFRAMFYGANAFDTDVSKWKVSSATDMGYMFFSNAATDTRIIMERNLNISLWQVGKVIDMRSMFSGVKVTCDLSKWDVSNVQFMQKMFGEDSKEHLINDATNVDVSQWNISSVTNLESTFSGLTNFNSDLSKWITSRVTDLDSTFWRAESFNSDLSKWQVENVLRLGKTFQGAKEFNSDLSKWDVVQLGVGWSGINGAIDSPMAGAFTGTDAFNGILCNDAWAFSPLVGASKTDSGLPTIVGGRFFCCKPGHHRDVSDNGVETCKQCLLGSVAAHHNAKLSCEQCNRNTFSGGLGLTRCSNCANDTFSGIGQARCTRCSPGQFMVRDSLNTTCKVCAAGQFQENSGQGKRISIFSTKKYCFNFFFPINFLQKHASIAQQDGTKPCKTNNFACLAFLERTLRRPVP